MRCLLDAFTGITLWNDAPAQEDAKPPGRTGIISAPQDPSGEAGPGTCVKVPTHMTTVQPKLGAGPSQCHIHHHSTHNVSILLLALKAARMPRILLA